MFTACVCLGILLIPFMKIYTMGIHDANYIRPVTAILFVLLTIGKGIRTPSMTMILAVGHYKQTKIPAVIEAVINIVVSLLLVRPLGINGLLIGTVCSHIYRTTDVILYNDRAIVTNTKKTSGKRILRNSLISIILIYVGNIANHKLMILSWAGWIMYAVLSGFVSLVVIVTVNAIAEKDEIKSVINLVKRILYKG